MPIQYAIIIGTILALAGTILSFIFIVPKSKRDTLPKFFKFIHDLFNFRFLIIETILKFFYILSTLFVIAVGFFMLFSVYGVYGWYTRSTALAGFLLMVFGPVFVRLIYESSMMFILLVKNTIEINNKLKDQNNNAKNSVFFDSSNIEFKAKTPKQNPNPYPQNYQNQPYQQPINPATNPAPDPAPIPEPTPVQQVPDNQVPPQV